MRDRFARTIKWVIRFCACAAALPMLISAARAQTQNAPVRADDFVDSIGMNGLGGPYIFRYGDDRQKLYNTSPVAPQYLLGVRHARYEIRPDSDLAPMIRLAKERGIRINALVSWLWTDTPANKSARIADVLPALRRFPAGCIVTIEGNNESDMPFESGDYPRYASSTREAQTNQRELYRAIKADSQFKNTPVIAWTLGKNWPWGGNIGYGAFTSTDYDYESMHSYPAGDTISDSLLTPGHNQWLKVAHSIAPPGAAAKPIIATETGFQRRMTGPNKKEINSELAQAKTIPMLLAENFRRGVKRTFIYAIGGEPAWTIDTREDGTPLPAGRARRFSDRDAGRSALESRRANVDSAKIYAERPDGLALRFARKRPQPAAGEERSYGLSAAVERRGCLGREKFQGHL